MNIKVHNLVKDDKDGAVRQGCVDLVQFCVKMGWDTGHALTVISKTMQLLIIKGYPDKMQALDVYRQCTDVYKAELADAVAQEE